MTSTGMEDPWHDTSKSPSQRAAALIELMTLEEKLAQLVGIWAAADASGGGVAPHQADMTGQVPQWEEVIRHGLGQITRPYGTVPVDPAAGFQSLHHSQQEIIASSRFGIPAQVHEECLAGFAAWQATAYPIPPSWGATFDPNLIEQMAQRIGTSMRQAGVHQGLAPVLDVARDLRWGRVEETISEDPYLVGTIGTAYVRGLESAGIVATLKHFAGYSASRAARNLAPVSMGSREFADVILPPFEMAVRDGKPGSVMHSYSDVDGVPAAADPHLLTELLREEWGFPGTVVADYFGVAFLEKLHKIAADRGQAAVLALSAGVDVELPNVDAYGQPLLEEVRAGRIDEAVVNDAVLRVLTQKAELGLLDANPQLTPSPTAPETFDTAADAELALEIARRAVVLIENRDDALPLNPDQNVAVLGPLADDPMGVLGCYSFPAHVGVHHPEHEIGIDISTVREQFQQRFARVQYATGCDITGPDTNGFAPAIAAAKASEVAVVVLGDRAGLFGRGTSGEGNDVPHLRLPGVQEEFARAIIDTGTPTILVLMTGRPYALGTLADDAAGIVQAFFPGQRGGQAIAEILCGEIEPAGRLPFGIPDSPYAQPHTYLGPPLAQKTGVSHIDPEPRYPFGHGRSYGHTVWSEIRSSSSQLIVDGVSHLELDVRNDSARPVSDVVQLYLHRPVAEVVQPVNRLIGYARVDVGPGETRRVHFTIPADVTAFTGLAGQRIVPPGPIELRIGRSVGDMHGAVALDVIGERRSVDHNRSLYTEVEITIPAEMKL